jgi:hypothetical protein
MATLDAATEASNSSATSSTVNRPTGNTAGHLLTMTVVLTASRTVTTPAGWTLIGDVTDAATKVRVASYSRVADGSEAATFSVSFSGSARYTANCTRYSPAAGKVFTGASIVGYTTKAGGLTGVSALSPGTSLTGDVSYAICGLYDLSNTDAGTLTVSGTGWTQAQASSDASGAGSVIWANMAYKTAANATAVTLGSSDGVDYSIGQAFIVRDYTPTSQTLFFGTNC